VNTEEIRQARIVATRIKRLGATIGTIGYREAAQCVTAYQSDLCAVVSVP